MDKRATSKSTQFSTKVLVKLLFLLENPLKLSFWGPLKYARSQTHSDSIISKHTEQVKKLCMDLSWHMHSRSHWKARIWLPTAFKKIPDTPTQCTEAEPSFRKVSLPPAKLCMPFPTHHLGYRVLATNLLPLMNRLTYPGVGILSLNSIG